MNQNMNLNLGKKKLLFASMEHGGLAGLTTEPCKVLSNYHLPHKRAFCSVPHTGKK